MFEFVKKFKLKKALFGLIQTFEKLENLKEIPISLHNFNKKLYESYFNALMHNKSN